ncbi:uncharacterized protein F5891DRAFT_172279 [Suillus fuscotomentosus]|uniref:Uncharacterized protein n=1 Tax=Suillus fuscotomentosus TaxID=1912939 RepID=A0AAD4E999_9AGAM|nr:uncharacterized protein F5891DRAFT_172279 [Suillus fuscotomentosus]KAG1902080.1 hypothetical protein F5891DRAFT_172279 [Suillus fuscotomentosus]
MFDIFDIRYIRNAKSTSMDLYWQMAVLYCYQSFLFINSRMMIGRLTSLKAMMRTEEDFQPRFCAAPRARSSIRFERTLLKCAPSWTTPYKAGWWISGQLRHPSHLPTFYPPCAAPSRARVVLSLFFYQNALVYTSWNIVRLTRLRPFRTLHLRLSRHFLCPCLRFMRKCLALKYRTDSRMPLRTHTPLRPHTPPNPHMLLSISPLSNHTTPTTHIHSSSLSNHMMSLLTCQCHLIALICRLSHGSQRYRSSRTGRKLTP